MDLQKNLDKANQLLPRCQYAARKWMTDCFNQNIRFIVASVYRTQAEQNALYEQGRTKPGNKVTWTLHSNHTLRIAMDIVMEQGTYEQAAQVASNYGIHRDPALVELGDVGHFEFDTAIPEPTVIKYTPAAIVRRFNRLIAAAQSAVLRNSLVERLQKYLAGKGDGSTW